MNIIRAVALAALLPLSLSADVSNDNNEEAPAPCAGCTFGVAPAAPGGVGIGPNPCGTQVRLSVFGLSGSCKRPAPAAACVPSTDCFTVRVLEIQSNCAMRLETSDGRSFGFQPTGGWILADAIVLSIPCGGGEMGGYELEDQSGHLVISGYFYWCTPCSG